MGSSTTPCLHSHELTVIGLTDIKATVKAIYHAKKFVSSTEEVAERAQLGIVLDRTNFYAESGGQEFDTGRLVIDGVGEVCVQNVQAYGGYVLHTGFVNYGKLSVGDEVICEYDEVSVEPSRCNEQTRSLCFCLYSSSKFSVDTGASLTLGSSTFQVVLYKLRFTKTYGTFRPFIHLVTPFRYGYERVS